MKPAILLFAAAALAVTACATTPEEQHELACIGGTLTGAVAGGLVGNMIGKGGGNALATAAGAGLGTYAGNRLACR